MTDTKNCPCNFNLVLQFINSIILILILVTQGSILDYYLILHNGGTSGWYFWFLADLLVLIAFMSAVVISYRYYNKKARMIQALKSGHKSIMTAIKLAQNPPNSPPKPLPKAGLLPLAYLVWVFYVTLLVVKIIILFKMEIAQNLDDKTSFGPQLLKVVIGMSSVVFFLLVESHSDAEPQSERLAYMHLLITGTAFEIFDSITFLGILLPNQSHVVLPFALEDVILGLSCANLFLPGLALYKLSQCEFGLRKRSLGLSLFYKAIHLLLINIPFLVIRIFLWTAFDHDISLFLMKNIMAVVVHILTSVPEVKLWLELRRAKRSEEGERCAKTNGLELKVIVGGALMDNSNHGNDQFDDVNLNDNEKDRENSRL